MFDPQYLFDVKKRLLENSYVLDREVGLMRLSEQKGVSSEENKICLMMIGAP